MGGWKKYLWLIGVSLFLYVAVKVDWQGVLFALTGARPIFLILSFTLIFPMLFLKTLRWKVFTNALRIQVKTSSLFKMTSRGVFWGIATPGRLGEFVRAHYLSDKTGVSLADSIWSVFMHKFLDVVDTCLFGVLSVVALALFFKEDISYLIIFIFLGIILLALFVYELIKKNKATKPFHLIVNFITPHSLRQKVDGFVDEMLRLTSKVSWSDLGYSFLLEIGQILLLAYAELLIALALGIDIPFWFILATVPFIDFIDALPISVLGLGPREASYVFLFSFLAVSGEQALAFSLLVGVWALFNALPGLFANFFSRFPEKGKASGCPTSATKLAEVGPPLNPLNSQQSSKQVILSFDLELWYETDWLKPYLPENYKNNDYLIEQVKLILGLLAKYQAKATFFVSGLVAEKYPQVLRQIAGNGHEIASHGLSHKELFELGPEKFEQELIKSKKILQEAIGEDIKGFRAPRFSLNEKSKWALSLLQKYGFQYDSSVFPMKTGSYGIKGGMNRIYPIDFENIAKEDKSSSLIEIPLAIVGFLGIKIPIAGGVYFRLMPFWLFKALLKKIAKKRMAILYFHPHELYSKTPQIEKGLYLKRMAKNWGVADNKSAQKFEKLLKNFAFDSAENILKL